MGIMAGNIIYIDVINQLTGHPPNLSAPPGPVVRGAGLVAGTPIPAVLVNPVNLVNFKLTLVDHFNNFFNYRDLVPNDILILFNGGNINTQALFNNALAQGAGE